MKRIKSLPIYQVLLLGLLLAIANSCNTEIDPKLLPVLTTSEISKVTEATAQSGGIITADGGFEITLRGICWNTSPNPTIKDSITKDAAGTGTFVSNITRLLPNTTYYARAYATNKKGTAYGLQVSFTTKTLTLSTSEIDSITTNSAKSGGATVTNGDSLNILNKGICWSKQSNPTISNFKTTEGRGSGKYVSYMTGLDLGTKYYVRAYVTNSGGTLYGNELNFTTKDGTIALSTTEASSITATSVTIGGTVPTDGGAPVTERGLCISKLPSPTIANKMANGSGIGSFATNITGLNANTTYYVRAYATNSVTTNYGNEISFKTLDGVIGLTTNEANSITISSVTIGGNISSDGGASVISRGICWDTNPNPTTANSKSINSSGLGSFSNNITGLSRNTTYYVRVYATNSINTYYGNEISFKTRDGIIILSTTPASSISEIYAISGGNISSDGGVNVTARGLCWSNNQNPTTADSKTSNGTGTGTFTSTLTGLSPNTTY